MRRRQVLVGAAAVAAPSLAGCSTLTGPTTLGLQEIEREGRETHLQWTQGDRRATLTVRQRTVPATPEDAFRLRLHVSHGRGLQTEYLQFRLHAPREPGTVPAAVSLEVPEGGPWPPFVLRREQWTTIAVEDLNELGRGSLGLELWIRPRSDPVEAVTVDATIGFTGTGVLDRQYVARAAEPVDIVHDG